MIKELIPDAKTVGILYCSAEPNSKYQASKIEEALDADGIAYKEYTASDSNDITSVVQNAVSEVDVIYIPTDNTMANNTETINNITLPAGIPVIAGEKGICSVSLRRSVVRSLRVTKHFFPNVTASILKNYEILKFFIKNT